MWDKAIIAGLAWFIAIYKFNAMRRDGQWRTGSVTFYYWAFALFFAIGLTFMIWPVYLAFDRFTGLPNFGWLIIYASFSLAVYFSSAACYLILKQPQPRLLPWSLLVTLAILIAIYIVGIVTLPEKADHTIPEQLSEVIFMETIYVYVAVFCAIPIFTFTRLFWGEKIVSARIRWAVGIVLSLAATAVLIIKIVLTLLAFRNPNTPALAALYPLISIGVVIVGILFPLAFLPNKWYLAAARPFEFVGKVISMVELKALQNRLNTLCPPVIEDKLTLRETLNDLDFHLYRAVIAILYAKQTLAGYAGITDDFAVQPVTMAHKAGKTPPAWSEQKLQQARLLHHELQKTDDEADFTQMVQSYRKISRVVAWKIRPYADYGGGSIDYAYQR